MRRSKPSGHACTVRAIDDLSPRFRRVALAGDGLRGHDWEPCQVTSFWISATEVRHYTPDGFDAVDGTMSILFHRRDPDSTTPSPGQAWLENLTVGDEVIAFLTGTGRCFEAHPDARSYLLFGDATTVGLWSALIGWLPPDARVSGAVEVPADDVDLVAALLHGVDVVAETDQPGIALLDWLDGTRPSADVEQPHPDHVYLAGHAQTIQRLRGILCRQFGVDRRAIHTQPYWTDRRTGT